MPQCFHKRSGKAVFFGLAMLVTTVSHLYGVDEESLLDLLENTILSDYEQHYEKGFMAGKDGIKIYYAKREREDEKGALLVLPGRKEYVLKYAEFLHDIEDWGYSIYIMDHRGQGKSGRLLSDSAKGHVKLFSDYVEDFGMFLNEVVNKTPHKKRYVVAHSMGGAIALLYALEHPEAIDGMVLCSPMLQVKLPRQSSFLTVFTAVLMDSLWLGNIAVPFAELFSPEYPFAKNRATHSPFRYKMNSMLLQQNNEQFVGPPTFHWLRQGMNAAKILRGRAGQLQTPTLILQAAEDQVVAAAGQNDFCKQTAVCQVKIINSAYHELLMEKDEIRNQAMEAILDFLAEHTL